MISLDLMKSSEVRKAGDPSMYLVIKGTGTHKQMQFVLLDTQVGIISKSTSNEDSYISLIRDGAQQFIISH